jgi:hypothetical protein
MEASNPFGGGEENWGIFDSSLVDRFEIKYKLMMMVAFLT